MNLNLRLSSILLILLNYIFINTLYADDKIVLRIVNWAGAEELKLEQANAAEFMKIYPNIKVRVETIPTGFREKILTNIASGNPPDVFLLDAGDIPAFIDGLQHLILPAIALAIIPMAIIARMTRSSMLDVLQEDYIRTAHAKGVMERYVLFRHALKNAFLPVITIIGLQAGILLAGAVLTETIFSWPGIGKWVYDAIIGRDYPIVQGGTLLIALLFVFINLFIDISYAYLDPRIHYD